MAKIYYRKIKAEEMTLEEVPERWRDAVRKMLEEDGSLISDAAFK